MFWAIHGSNLGTDMKFLSSLNYPERLQTASCFLFNKLFSGVKRLGRDVDH
jgi:hypothetical protein